MFRARGSPPPGERGQGLVEYALILMLVGIVVILVLILFGEALQKQYCQIVYSVNPEAEIEMCETIEVACNYTTGSGWVNLEANVTDTAGVNDVKNVKFYNDGNYVRTEWFVPYCMGSNPSGGTSCNNYNTSSGSHTIVAIATDDEGNTGQCEVTVNVP